MSIIITPVSSSGTIVAAANCYVSLATAEDYLEYITSDDEWSGRGKTNPDDDQKERLLIRATRRHLEPLFASQDANRFDCSTPQPLMFPRYWDVNPATGKLWIDPDLERATALLASWLWTQDNGGGDIVDAEKAREQGIRRFQAGDLEVEFGKTSWRRWPAEIKTLVAKFFDRDAHMTEGPVTRVAPIFTLPGFGPSIRR